MSDFPGVARAQALSTASCPVCADATAAVSINPETSTKLLSILIAPSTEMTVCALE
jgi:hypothetical protein